MIIKSPVYNHSKVLDFKFRIIISYLYNKGVNMALKGSKTEENLKAAFAGESQANRR